jgi:hypothetical protein
MTACTTKFESVGKVNQEQRSSQPPIPENSPEFSGCCWIATGLSGALVKKSKFKGFFG